MTFRESLFDAAGRMVTDAHETGFYFTVSDDGLPCDGSVTVFHQKNGEDRASLELHGLTEEETARVLRVLRLGAKADGYLERALAEAATY